MGVNRDRSDDMSAKAFNDVATVPVAVVSSRTEAELIAGMLRSQRLTVAVSADDAGGQEPELQAQGVRVLVPPADEALARQLLSAADDTPSVPGSPNALQRWMSRLFGTRRT